MTKASFSRRGCPRIRQNASRLASGGAARTGSRLAPVLCRGGLSQPVVEADLAEVESIRRHQAALFQLGAEVPRLRVSDDRARVSVRSQGLLDELIEAE